MCNIRCLVIALVFASQFSYANCDQFLDSKLNEMNLGKFKQPTCGVLKKEEELKTRVSMSKVKGRKDRGPTLTLYKSDPSNIKIVQLLSKDKVTKNAHRFTYILSDNCNEVKSVTYKLGTLQSEITYEKCHTNDDSFSDLEKASLNVHSLCNTYFPEKSNVSSEDKTKSTSVVPN